MPNKKSAAKRVRTSEKARVLNKSYKTSMKNKIKAVLKALEEGKTESEILELYKKAQSSIDKAAQHGGIHRNQAARRKARIIAKIKKHFGTSNA